MQKLQAHKVRHRRTHVDHERAVQDAVEQAREHSQARRKLMDAALTVLEEIDEMLMNA